MKKISAILLTIFYFFTTIGIVVNIHYCHGIVSSINLFVAQESCNCDHENGISNCCNDKTLVIIDDSDEKIINSFNTSFINQFEGTENVYLFYYSDSIEKKFSNPLTDVPPPKKQPSWLLNCNFIFYG